MCFSRFAPYEGLARALLPVNEATGDGSHDTSHLIRVWNNARTIQAQEGGDSELIAAAVLLHDCVQVPKDSPLRKTAADRAAGKARAVLADRLGWDGSRADVVSDAIAAHSFSAEIAPKSLEGRILQDADRLDAIGLIGIARCFYTAGRLNARLYDGSDPRGDKRELRDDRFALDHFPRKLLRLRDAFQTPTGQRLARERHNALERFYRGFLEEIDS
jgi:uncharacterized protein